jgi:two-component system KDP operon response regulator KdpE
MTHQFNYIQNSTILVIDDEPKLRKLLTLTLQNYNANVITANNAKEGIEFSKSHRADLILLDLNLGDDHGLNVLTDNKPIIILSVENDADLIVQALNLGADDYLTKPFDVNILLARIHTAIRRVRKTETPQNIYEHNELKIDFDKRIVTLSDKEIKLTKTEYDLLKLFIINAGKVLTYRFILKEIWGPSHVEHNQYPRVYVRHLRSKIEQDPENPKFILTDPGVGYRFIEKTH